MNQDPFGLDSRPPLSMTFVDTDLSKAVVLERIEDKPEPEYCVHGRTRCFGCNKWCHLGIATYEVVAAGGATPFCLHCAHKVVHKDKLIGYLDDRGRSHRA